MVYTSLEQRMASAYLAMLPDFVPDTEAEVTVTEQREFYDFMKRVYQLFFDNPALIVPVLHEDDAFPSRYKKAYGKPELQVDMSKCKKAMQTLLEKMFLMGQGSAVELNRRQRGFLSALGLGDLGKLPAAWVWMSTRPGADQIAFAYCLFDRNHVYAADLYARLLGEESFRRLERWMVGHGYKAYDIYNTAWPDYRLTLTYANPAWSDDLPNQGCEYKIKHTGISAQYDGYTRNPGSFGLCIPHGLKRFLERFDSMSHGVQAFVVERTKKCDGCRYCVQTDKSGTRPFAFVTVTHMQVEYNLCPHFPGYQYCWTSIDDQLVEQLIKMLMFMDQFAPVLG